jgi:NADH dehydrogenase
MITALPLRNALGTIHIMRHQTIAIIGGTGFIGSNLACELARRRYRVRVISRRRERNRQLLVIPSLELVEANVHSAASLSNALRGCDAVVNLVGILNERQCSGESFADVHARAPQNVAEAARFNRITRVLHMSALGADTAAPSQYLRSKARGEQAAHAQAAEGMQVTSFRPSVVFGPRDGLFSMLANTLRLSPYFLPLACAQSRMAPLYVGDLARAMANCLDDSGSFGQRYDLCGPRSYSLAELAEYTARVLGLRRRVIALPDALARMQARLLQLIPGSPFTMDNYLSLQVDSVCGDSNAFARLGITPVSLETVVPGYLAGRGNEQLYSTLRETAGR